MIHCIHVYIYISHLQVGYNQGSEHSDALAKSKNVTIIIVLFCYKVLLRKVGSYYHNQNQSKINPVFKYFKSHQVTSP